MWWWLWSLCGRGRPRAVFSMWTSRGRYGTRQAVCGTRCERRATGVWTLRDTRREHYVGTVQALRGTVRWCSTRRSAGVIRKSRRTLCGPCEDIVWTLRHIRCGRYVSGVWMLRGTMGALRGEAGCVGVAWSLRDTLCGRGAGAAWPLCGRCVAVALCRRRAARCVPGRLLVRQGGCAHLIIFSSEKI